MYLLFNVLALWWLQEMPTTSSRRRYKERCNNKLCARDGFYSLQQAVISSCPPLQAHASLPHVVKPLALYLGAVSLAG